MHHLRTAGFIGTGTEILLGEIRDSHVQFLGKILQKKGIELENACFVKDELTAIESMLNVFISQYQYVFISGGIGPTHDDLTARAIANITGLDLIFNEDIYRTTESYYDNKIANLQKKTAYIPAGAEVIHTSLGPNCGFMINNIYALSGSPKIFQDMIKNVLPMIISAKPLLSYSLRFEIGEHKIIEIISAIQDCYDNIEIGSHPFVGLKTQATTITLSGTDLRAIQEAMKQIEDQVNQAIDKDNEIYTS